MWGAKKTRMNGQVRKIIHISSMQSVFRASVALGRCSLRVSSTALRLVREGRTDKRDKLKPKRMKVNEDE